MATSACIVHQKKKLRKKVSVSRKTTEKAYLGNKECVEVNDFIIQRSCINILELSNKAYYTCNYHGD